MFTARTHPWRRQRHPVTGSTPKPFSHFVQDFSPDFVPSLARSCNFTSVVSRTAGHLIRKISLKLISPRQSPSWSLLKPSRPKQLLPVTSALAEKVRERAKAACSSELEKVFFNLGTEQAVAFLIKHGSTTRPTLSTNENGTYWLQGDELLDLLEEFVLKCQVSPAQAQACIQILRTAPESATVTDAKVRRIVSQAEQIAARALTPTSRRLRRAPR